MPADGRKPEVRLVREDLVVRELIDRTADRSGSKADGTQPSEVMSTLAKILRVGLLIVHDGRCWS